MILKLGKAEKPFGMYTGSNTFTAIAVSLNIFIHACKFLKQD
jgi:hypothetical protein